MKRCTLSLFGVAKRFSADMKSLVTVLDRKFVPKSHMIRSFLSSNHCRNIRGQSFFELHDSWINRFAEAKIPEPTESSGYITAHVLGYKTFSVIPREALSRTASSREKEYLESLCSKRLQRMPLQYVIGNWDFYGVNLKMKAPVFIPRPETEELADRVFNDILLKMVEIPFCKVLEIGCGSGAISLSLLNKLITEPVHFVAADAAPHAVELTKENADRLNLLSDKTSKLQIVHHKVGEDDDVMLSDLGPFDIIVSNPPYIPSADMRSLPEEISGYEDHAALHGGDTGLDVIQDLLEASQELLAENGLLWLEVDSSHPAILKKSCRRWLVECYSDIFRVNRFLRVSRCSYSEAWDAELR